ncbi:endonuclease/exonuclease/phosphatase family protein [Subtercola lobariae]|uniref:Membrane protein n=1 Tax=Subtercola lobariae TaxID=1588641 RepID=A0A917F1H1_9MICO|nr:endonuclease/exonuclease/phosphatase family protein [Subtercola lobariae]GGF38934.1 membrane protein [Subtercola lobariae]
MSLLLATRPTPAVSAPNRPDRRTSRPAFVALTIAFSLILTGLILFHTAVPDIGGIGLLLDTAIPWFGLLVVPLFVMALLSRRRRTALIVLLPALVWGVVIGPGLVPLNWSAPAASTADGTHLTVASQNIEADSGTGATSAATLAATGADVIALEEMTSDDFDTISSTLAADYPYSYGVGTVGVWSKYPVINAQPLNLGLGWNRALAADVQTPQGLVSIYVIHAASARPGDVSARDSMLAALASTLPNDENSRVIAVGDFNAASTDRAMGGIEGQLTEANQSEGMLGSTWPASLPVTRLDHLLQRGMTVTSNTTLTAGDSDHRAILTSMNL